MSLGTIFTALLKIFGWWFDPTKEKKRRKESILTKIIQLETDIGVAFAEGKVMTVSRLARQIEDLRERLRYVEAV